MIEKGHSEDMLKLMLYSMESIIERISESGNEQFSLIVDLEGLTYWKVAHYESKSLKKCIENEKQTKKDG